MDLGARMSLRNRCMIGTVATVYIGTVAKGGGLKLVLGYDIWGRNRRKTSKRMGNQA